MNRNVPLASAIALLAAAGTVNAHDYVGSESLKVWTQTLVAQCALSDPTLYAALAATPTQFNFLGGGSGLLGPAWIGTGTPARATQDIGPITRHLNAAEACATTISPGIEGEAGVTVSAGSGAEELVIGLDGLSIAESQTTGARCRASGADTNFGAPLALSSAKTFTVTDFSTNVPDGAPTLTTFETVPLTALDGLSGITGSGTTRTYTVQDFKDVLRVLFAGADRTLIASAAATPPGRTGAGNGGGAQQSEANRLSRCSSDIRRSLVANWDNIVEATSCTGARCDGTTSTAAASVRRLFRRSDDAATSDVFLTLLGLAKVANHPFCNGTERDDLDPVRRTCLPADDVCAAQNTGLGLVQAVELHEITPAPAGTVLDAQYPTTPCATGIFVLRNAPLRPDGSSVGTCPDGGPQFFGQCLTPQSGPASAVGTAAGVNCLNDALNVAFTTPGGNDGRAWNRELRSSSGNMRNERIPGSAVASGITNAVHRLRSRGPSGPAQCLGGNATSALGCLASQVPCSAGFSDRGATDSSVNPLAIAAPVNNVAPTILAIQTGQYPLARREYFSSLLGFNNIRAGGAQDEQKQLIHCLEHVPSAHSAANLSVGLVDLPDPAAVPLLARETSFRAGPSLGTSGAGIPGLACYDVDEQSLCGAATGVTNCTTLVSLP